MGAEIWLTMACRRTQCSGFNSILSVWFACRDLLLECGVARKAGVEFEGALYDSLAPLARPSSRPCRGSPARSIHLLIETPGSNLVVVRRRSYPALAWP